MVAKATGCGVWFYTIRQHMSHVRQEQTSDISTVIVIVKVIVIVIEIVIVIAMVIVIVIEII